MGVTMAMPTVSRFRGLNNTQDGIALGLSWLVQADNVDVTDAGNLQLRTGYTQAMAATPSGAYATLDEQRMYLVDAGTLKAMNTNGTSAVTLASGLSTARMAWAEINGQVFYSNGTDSGIIAADNEVMPWAWDVPAAPTLAAVTGNLDPGLYRACITHRLPDGRETGPSDVVELEIAEGQALQVSGIEQIAGQTTHVYIAPANSTVFQRAGSPGVSAIVWNASPDNLGVDLETFGMDPLPSGCDVIAAWRGRLVAAQYDPAADASAVWLSQPLGFHLFDLEADMVMVPGRVLMLAPQDAGLVIGTENAILAYSAEGLAELAPYGVVAGQHWSPDDDNTVVFWSQRGICRALPFANLTQQYASVAPGVHAGGAVVRMGGQRRYIVSIQQGGSAFNST